MGALVAINKKNTFGRAVNNRNATAFSSSDQDFLVNLGKQVLLLSSVLLLYLVVSATVLAVLRCAGLAVVRHLPCRPCLLASPRVCDCYCL